MPGLPRRAGDGLRLSGGYPFTVIDVLVWHR